MPWRYRVKNDRRPEIGLAKLPTAMFATSKYTCFGGGFQNTTILSRHFTIKYCYWMKNKDKLRFFCMPNACKLCKKNPHTWQNVFCKAVKESIWSSHSNCVCFGPRGKGFIDNLLFKVTAKKVNESWIEDDRVHWFLQIAFQTILLIEYKWMAKIRHENWSKAPWCHERVILLDCWLHHLITLKKHGCNFVL